MASSKAPKTPDYTSAAVAQGQADKEIAQYLTKANRVNQVDPYGQTTWTQTATPEQQQKKQAAVDQLARYNAGAAAAGWERWQPGAVAAERARLQGIIDSDEGQWTQTTTLTPEQQKLLNQQQFIGAMQNDRIAGLIRDTGNPTAPTLGGQRSLAQYGLAPERQLQQRTLDIAQMGPQRTLQQRQLAQREMAPQRQLKETNQNNIQDLLYGQITKQYGDRFAKEEASQRAQLANQGFQMGSEGYANTLGDFTKEKNAAYEDAGVQAALASYGQMNTERGQNLAEYNTLSADDLNRWNALTSNDLNQFNSLSANDLAQFNSLSADDLNRFQAQTTANLGNFGALTANDLDQFNSLSNNDLARFGALNANELNRFSALSSDDLNRYNSQLSQYNTDKGFLSQLLGGVAGPTNPQYQPYAQATPYQSPDLLGAMQGQYQGNLNKTNARNASNSSNMQTAGVVAAAAATAF